MNQRAKKAFEQNLRTNIRIPRKQTELMLFLKDIRSQAELCKATGKAKATMSYLLNELVKKRFAESFGGKRNKQYVLTKSGEFAVSNFLSEGSFEGNRFKFRVHNLCFSCLVLGKHKDYKPGKIIVPVEYPYTGKRNVTVVLYCDSAQINLFPIPAYSVEFAMDRALKILVATLSWLEAEYPGLRFAKEKELGHVVRMHVAIPFHPQAVEFAKFFQKHGSTFVVNGRHITVDFSEGNPELEATDGIKAKDTLLKKIERDDYFAEEENWNVLKRMIEEKKAEQKNRNDAKSEA